jgi:hypothetical protein
MLAFEMVPRAMVSAPSLEEAGFRLGRLSEMALSELELGVGPRCISAAGAAVAAPIEAACLALELAGCLPAPLAM